jgi:hypothetical protein
LTRLVRKVAVCLPGWAVYGIALAREPKHGLWQVIDFQLDKYVTARRFTVNLGLHDTALESFFAEWARLDPKRPDTAACNLGRARLGQLIGGEDRWWDLPSEDGIDSTTRDLCSLLMKFAVPDFDRFRSNQAIAEAWMKSRKPSGLFKGKKSPWFQGGAIALAAELKVVGRDQEARDVAAAEIGASKGHPSEEWLKTVATRLDLQSG